MTILIGYWSSGSNKTQDELQQRLDSVLKIYRTNMLYRSYKGSGNFGISVGGRHASLKNDKKCLTATLSVSGEGFAPDVWTTISTDKLSIGRESFGRGTIFWTTNDNVVWFSSRLDLLLKLIERPRISITGFYLFGCFSYIPAPHTPLENVFAIKAGTESTWQQCAATPESRSLHEWREADEQNSDEQVGVGRLRQLLEESVETQLASSRGEPVGVFLSGGLDSSITTALLVRAGANVRAYTLDFQADCFSEVQYAELVARTLKVPLTKIPVTAKSMRRSLPSTARRLDGLYGDGVTVPLDLLYHGAAKDVRIVFNGEGGDQLFAGWTNKPLIAASVYEATNDDPTELSDEQFLAQYMRTFHRFHGHEAAVYSNAVRREVDASSWRAVLARALDPSFTKSLIHRLRRANLLLKGADNIQPRAGNLGLSYNLDVRTLFASRQLADWTFSITGELWLRGGCEKYLLKRAVEDLLPAEVVWREKRGMGVPLTQWLSGPLRRWMRRQLPPRALNSEGFWEPDLVERIAGGELSGHVQGRRIGEMLWLMLIWRAWREHFPGPSKAKQSSDESWRFTFPFTSLPRRTPS
jgi:asparagine synthase (glutamine-hydrolysing)